MITGIDETGDFDPNSKLFNFFVGVHLDQNSNKLTIKRSQFNIWEGSIPEKYKIAGEVKGQNIPDEYLVTFFNEVLEIKPTVLYSAVRIVPFQNPPELLEKHKAYEVKQFEKVIAQATEAEHLNWADGYKKILAWYKNRNYQIQMKMKCLEHLLGISLNHILGWAQITYILDNNDITNLRDISFKIDKDFVRAENVKIIWNEIFRQFWQQFTHRDPLPIMAAWRDEDHPFLKLYEAEGGKTNMKNIFRNNTQFLDSKDSWEIRMADLVGTILHRYQNRGKCNEIGEKMMKHLGKKQKNYTHIILNDVPNF